MVAAFGLPQSLIPYLDFLEKHIWRRIRTTLRHLQGVLAENDIAAIHSSQHRSIPY